MSDPSFNPEFLSVMARMGARPSKDDPERGTMPVTEHLATVDVMGVAPLMLLADTVVGMALESLFDDWTFTTDFSFRRATPFVGRPGDVAHLHARPLRHGRRLLVEELEYTDRAGNAIGYGQITFMRTPLREGETKPDIGEIRERMATQAPPPLEQPLPVFAGIEIADRNDGRVELRPTESVRRPGGFVQGAIITLMGELAALVLAESTMPGSWIVTDLDARYLIGGRTGPLRTSASWIGDPASGAIRVALHDDGHDGVTSTTFLVRVAPVG